MPAIAENAARVRLLMVEDLHTDAELEIRELRRAGLSVEHRLVDREEDFLVRIADFAPDVIISDFSMPHFDGMPRSRSHASARPTCRSSSSRARSARSTRSGR
jgi:CheY-like chemotaxis protein